MKNVESNGRKTSREIMVSPAADGELDSRGRRAVGRRSFLKGIGMAGATLLPASSLVMTEAKAERTDRDRDRDRDKVHRPARLP